MSRVHSVLSKFAWKLNSRWGRPGRWGRVTPGKVCILFLSKERQRNGVIIQRSQEETKLRGTR